MSDSSDQASGVPAPPDKVCEHGTALDVHCCNCHSGFIFDKDHECPSPDLSLHRCKICGTRWLLWPEAIHGGGWNLLDKWQRPGGCCDNVAMGDQIEHLRDIPLAAPGAAAVARQAFREFASLAAWLENPNESCADRSNPSHIAAAIRGILQAASAVCRCPRCGDVTTEPDAYCAACQKTVTRNIEPAAVSPLALEEPRRKLAEMLVGEIRALTARSEQDRKFGPHACREAKIAAVLKAFDESARLRAGRHE